MSRMLKRQSYSVASRLLMQFVALLAASTATCESVSAEQITPDSQLRYEKQETRIAMRDGVTLYTAIYSPADASKEKLYPILLHRTPYGCWPYGTEHRNPIMYNSEMVQSGYIFVYQDLRSRSMSDGQPEFENLKPAYSLADANATDEITDASDTIDWLLENVEFHNSRVGLFGNSYMGWTALMGAASGHPSIRATLAAGPCVDTYFEDFTRNGLFCLAYAPILDWFGTPKVGRHPGPWWKNELDYWADGKRFGLAKDSYAYFLSLGPLKNLDRIVSDQNYFLKFLREHPNYDLVRQERNTLRYLSGIRCPTLIVGGWNDEQNLYGILQSFKKLSDAPSTNEVSFVMGPWSHGQHREAESEHYVGNIYYGSKINANYLKLEADWFANRLYSKSGDALQQKAVARVFDTGTKKFLDFAKYPPSGQIRPSRFYFAEHESLKPQLDESKKTRLVPDVTVDAVNDGMEEYFEFYSNPAKPVPYIESDEFNLFPAKHFMTDDQRFAAKRPDVLVFATEPLASELTIAGPLKAKLRFSTSRFDADLIVKIVDVLPMDREPQETDKAGIKMNGYQQLVRMGQIRTRYRHSYSEPEPMQSNTPEWIDVDLLDIHHTFGVGHRIMVQVQSSCFPLFDRNPQRYVENIFDAQESDFVPATHRIYKGSQLEFSVFQPQELN